MKDDVTLTHREQQRLLVLNRVLAGVVDVPTAAQLLHLSVRQVQRLVASYGAGGASTLVHGNRGRAPAHTVAEALRQRVLTLAATTYAGCNDTQLTEFLAERDGIVLDRSTVQRWRRAAGQSTPQRRTAPRHRNRRERMAQEGLLLQWDGSPHRWLGDRGPRLTLVGAIDDATNTVPAAHFREQEDAHGYLWVLRDILVAKGIPVAIYRDRHGIFERRQQEPWTLEEELGGQRMPTQVGRALEQLGIQSIAAHSPQAKGRIERLWRTLQDRLVSELRLANATTIAEAEAVLQAFLPRFNARFGLLAADLTAAYRSLPAAIDPEQVCCFAYLRTVALDNTVTLAPHRFQLLPTAARTSFARAKVEVREHLNGQLTVWLGDQCLATQPAPATATTLRARKGARPAAAPLLPPPPPPTTPPASPRKHPWRTYPRTDSLHT
jgi:transposase